MAGAADCWILTPAGAGGVAVVAFQGERRWALAGPLLRVADRRGLGPGSGPRLAELWIGSERLDQVLVVDRPQLQQLEVHTHGSPAVLAALEEHLGGLQRRSPGPAEALLLGAMGPSQVALALEQLAQPLEGLLQQDVSSGLAAALARSRAAMAQAQPERLVICGAQNAGKSTLMNRLLHQERVLTGTLPGLTRDPVRERVLLGGYPYELVDTAGEGPPSGRLDELAQARGREERRTGLRLLVVDRSAGPAVLERQLMQPGTLVVENKIDLPAAAAPWPEELAPRVAVSCLSLAAAVVRRLVGEALCELRGLPKAGPVGGPAALDGGQLERLRQRLAARPTTPGG